MEGGGAREYETITFILLEPIKITSDVSLDAICRKYTGVMNIKLDGDILYTDDNNELKVIRSIG